jgi:N-methylhydantoinase A
MSPAEGQRFRIGIDVGGTFTDVVVSSGSAVWSAKASTTPGEVGRGVLDACSKVAGRIGLSPEELLSRAERVGLGTTAVTNVLAARTGLRTGLVTTAGFEDFVMFDRSRPQVEGGWRILATHILSRSQIVGIRERIDRSGTVLLPLDPGEVIQRVGQLVHTERVEAVAVSFLWSFRNPVHEETAVGLIMAAFPDLVVTSGAQLAPVIRESERTNLALLNAYCSGALGGIEALASAFRASGCQVPVLLMHSGGGMETIEHARRFPVSLAASGPAGGVAGAAKIAGDSGTLNALTCDMGGTSTDVSVIVGGVAARQTRGELMGFWAPLPRVDVESIGAGGGSIGWIDARGMLRVGPRSAGAIPGPACYGRGGADPTVTDALVVLGYIAPDAFLGGEMPLDFDAAWNACEQLGAGLGLGPEETAWGIRTLALEGMVKAIRVALRSKGCDPREYALISYGGCAGLFTADLAAAAGVAKVLVPRLASTLSAFGVATSDVRLERAISVGMVLPGDRSRLSGLAGRVSAAVEADLQDDGGDDQPRRSTFIEADIRFRGQAHELRVPVRALQQLGAASWDQLEVDFRDEYARRYGKGALTDSPVEVIVLRAIAIEAAGGDELRMSHPSSNGKETTIIRRVVTGPHEFADISVIDADTLASEARVEGPVIVDGADTTIWVPKGAALAVDAAGTIAINLAATYAMGDRA